MKRHVVICIIAFVSSLSLQAQIAIKPSVGANFTDWSKDPVTGEFQSKVGYQVGGSVAFGKHWFFEPGFYYVKKSTELVSTVGGANDATYNLEGIRIPVTIGLNLLGSQKGFINAHIFGGASVFFLTKAGGNNSISKDDFKDASWALFAGAGAGISMFFVDLQYEWSLTNISKTSVDVGKTRSIYINAGIRIPL